MVGALALSLPCIARGGLNRVNVAFVVLLVHLSISRRSLKQAMQGNFAGHVHERFSSGAAGDLPMGLDQRSLVPQLEEKLGFMFRNSFAKRCTQRSLSDDEDGL